MAWIKPKTNWVKTDYFNTVDFNRIKNNTVYLHPNGLASKISDKNNGDYLYYEDITDILDDIKAVADKLNLKDSLEWKSYSYLYYDTLNDIESFLYTLGDYTENQRNDGKMLSFSLGTGGLF